MARIIRISAAELQQAQQLHDEASTVREARKAMTVILLAAPGADSIKVASILGVCRATIFRDLHDFRTRFENKNSTWGGRRRYVMTLEDECEFLSEWKSKAEAGCILSVTPIHMALMEQLGYEVPPSTMYRMLARHGWRKVQPDTKHPKDDPGVQEKIKRYSRKWWLPPV